MSAARLLRLAGLLAVISAVLSIVGDLLSLIVDLENPTLATTSSYALVFGLYLLSAVLLLLGLIGIYMHQSQEAGTLGVVSFLMAFVGTALLAWVPCGLNSSLHPP